MKPRFGSAATVVEGSRDIPPFLSGGGEMGALIRAHDWAATPLGPPDTWPQSLRSTLSACLNSPILGAVLWGPDFRMLYNDAYIPSMADRHPAALGRPVADVWDTTWEQVAPSFHRAMETGEGFSHNGVELTMLRRGRVEQTYWNISAAPIRGEDGSIVGLLNQGIEITDQVLADRAREKERSAALRLYENIVRSDQAPICAFDTSYRLIAFNQAHNDEFFRVNGFYTEIGDIFPDLFMPEQRPVMRGLMTRALSGETFTVTEEFGRPELGKPCWEISYTPLRDETGAIIGAFHYAKDISARLRAEAELREAQDALRQSQKMEAVGQLTGGLAHDFNNLLAVITGSLDMLERRVLQGRVTEIDRFVMAAQAAAKRAAALTHRLLAFSRRQTLDPKPTGINQLIAGMDDLIRRTVGPQIAVETVGAAGLWTTLVDPPQLESALLNLCINARDAMPDGGRLTIETANRWLDERAARERDVPPGQYVSLCVSDTGCGMPPDVIAKAFDPFFTTKPIGQGTGLGLSMIYGFARQSGGQVRIYSEVGQGSMICIYLPRHYGEEVAGDEIALAAPEQAEPGETVLVVDDEPGVRMIVGEVLEELHYHIIEAEDGPAALKVISSKARIDLLVTDVGLPSGMNGRQVADAARVVRPDLKVLFITGYAENAVISNGQLDPGMAVITKPFAVDALANRIKDLISSPRIRPPNPRGPVRKPPV